MVSSEYTIKVKSIFGQASINKDLVNKLHTNDLPRYIFEWLLSKYSQDGEITSEKKRELFDLIEKHFPEPEKLEYYKYQMMKEDTPVHILNQYQVKIDAKKEQYEVYFPFFAGETKNLDIDPQIVDNNKGLLMNGLWGIAKIIYIPSGAGIRPFYIEQFSPVQIEEVNLEEFIAARNSFTTEDWIALLINTMGLNPEKFVSMEEKLYILSRMLPYVQNNYNLIEMGPKGSGKSFFHKNISTYSHVIGGGTISRAQLFFNIAKSQKGLVLNNDVVAFDDFTNLKIEGANEVIGKLKNYMADGIIDAGSFKETSYCSMMIMGNVALGSDKKPITRFHFRNLPNAMQESAFLDRLCGFIPGWMIRPIEPEDLSIDYGLIGDWFSEILHHLRRKNFLPEIQLHLKFTGNKIRQRDLNFLNNTANGFIKILFPNGVLNNDDWNLIGNISVDLRQRVIEQLANIDPEFEDISLRYEVI